LRRKENEAVEGHDQESPIKRLAQRVLGFDPASHFRFEGEVELDAARLDFGEVEHLVDHRQQVRAAVRDGGELAGLLARGVG